MTKRFLSFAALALSTILLNAQTISTVTVYADSAHLLNTFIPAEAFGVGIDGHEYGDNDRIFTRENIKAMLTVGFKPVSYRLRTELGNEVWHWNPRGSWSDTVHKQGYWTSSTDAGFFIKHSYGYRLPRRGNSMDQANNDGYSRITDGDTKSFWKSNPYLDAHYTGEPDSLHPQWIVVNLGKEMPVDAIKILWGEPFATSFTVEYAGKSVDNYFDNSGYFEIDSPQVWNPFPVTAFTNAKSGSQLVRLSNTPITAQVLRIRMNGSSHTAPKSSTDVRDSLGYAVKEVYVGTLERGVFRDLLRHTKNGKKQSMVHVSSTDLWHRSSDIDSLTEQEGIDRFYHSGITGNTPPLLSAGLLYDTPENTAGFIDYVTKKNYPVAGVELGEEPDGQMVNASDFGELYRQWTQRIRQHHPAVFLGGPSLQSVILDLNGEIFPTKKWMQGFTSYLQRKGALDAFQFFSFEWYPFDNVCAPSQPQLLRAPFRLGKAMADLQSVPALKKLPFYITEYGYSAFAGISEVSMQGALLNADIAAKFLSKGGNKAFMYGWEPNNLQSDFGCPAGNNMLFGMDDDGKITFRTATYYGAQMMRQWAQPFSQPLQLYTASTDARTKEDEEIITAYALRLPDKTWSLLLINKDSTAAHPVDLKIASGDGGQHLLYPLTVYQYSGEQYQWKNNGLNGHPVKELPPVKKTIEQGRMLTLPPYSLTVVRSSKP